jgi:hypothetical protein
VLFFIIGTVPGLLLGRAFSSVPLALALNVVPVTGLALGMTFC